VLIHASQARINAEELSLDKFDVLVTSYEVAIKEKAKLRKFPWTALYVSGTNTLRACPVSRPLVAHHLILCPSMYVYLLLG